MPRDDFSFEDSAQDGDAAVSFGERRRGEESGRARSILGAFADRDGLHRLAEDPSTPAIGKHHLQPEAGALARIDDESFAAMGDVDDAVRHTRARTKAPFPRRPREQTHRPVRRRGQQWLTREP